MEKAKKARTASEVSEEVKPYKRRTPRKTAAPKARTASEVSDSPKLVSIESCCPNKLIDPNNGRVFPARAVTKDVVVTNWLEVQIAAGLLKEV